MERTTLASSSGELRVDIPSAWQELDEEQLVYVLHMLSWGFQTEHAMVYAFIRFAGLYIVRSDGDTLIVRRGRKLYPLSRRDVLLGAMTLDFIQEPPQLPQRPEKWSGAKAVDAELHGVPFGVYLQLENYMQRYLSQPDESLLVAMGRLLYPKLPKRGRLPRVFSYLVLHWMTGLKLLFARLYPDLFKPARADGELPDLREVMLAQIRALTAGDVTKEHDVLNVDTWTALAELNEKAREARELDKLYKH